MNKCPACGYNLKNSYNISPEIGKLLKSRNTKTRRYLNRIASEIMNNIPSESRENYFRFLFALKEVEDNVLDWAIEQFFKGKYYHQGKGFAYLRTIVQNRDKNIETLIKNERLRLGSPPPVIEIKQGE
tara:strand:- start:891 stop:1274 length:384 start_codon:yes stop_codon:yes gene_type:complete